MTKWTFLSTIIGKKSNILQANTEYILKTLFYLKNGYVNILRECILSTGYGYSFLNVLYWKNRFFMNIPIFLNFFFCVFPDVYEKYWGFLLWELWINDQLLVGIFINSTYHSIIMKIKYNSLLNIKCCKKIQFERSLRIKLRT